MKGYVYVLTNASMPGLVKIGKTTRNPEVRAAELFVTGVPSAFKVAFCLKSFDCGLCERLVHRELGRYRVSHDREFFNCEVGRAISTIEGVTLEMVDDIVQEYAPKYRLVWEAECVDIERLFPQAIDAGIDHTRLAGTLAFVDAEALRNANIRYESHLAKRAERLSAARKDAP